MKADKKIFKIAMIAVVFVIFINLGIRGIDIYQLSRSEKVNEYTNQNLGLLKSKVTNEEKNELKKLATIKMYLSEKRIQQNELELGRLESKISTQIDEKLNDYTIKYLLKDEEFEEDSNIGDFNYHHTLKKLKGTLSKADYKKLKRAIYEYEDGYYEEIDTIYSIVEKYNARHAETIVTYLLEANHLELKAFFNINKNIDIEYKSIEGLTSRKLSKPEYEEYQNIWDEIKYILPNEELKNFDELHFATDGKENELASVTMNNEQGSRWIMSLDPKDVETKGDKTVFYETILHEYFHYVSLNNKQVTYTYDYNMENYCEEGMVSNYRSYINEFYNQFWEELLDNRNVDRDNHYFYERHKDSFVNEYASTDPVEDLAETFSYFVLKDKPTSNDIKDEKIKFFYEYKELVQLRDELRNKINSVNWAS
ncbi:MAG: hypothetical protein ACI35O_06290 [Bacillaceae bacterium]